MTAPEQVPVAGFDRRGQAVGAAGSVTAVESGPEPGGPAGGATAAVEGGAAGDAPDEADPAEGDPSGPGPGRGDDATGPGWDHVTLDPDATEFRMALVASVTLDLPSQHPTVVLRELESPRRQLTFAIGMPDAVALSHAFRRIPTPRPLTHELMSDVLESFDIDVVAVRLVGRTGAVYFAELDLRGRSGRSVLSCRPSDALTVALQQPVSVPILIDARLLETDGDVAPPGA